MSVPLLSYRAREYAELGSHSCFFAKRSIATGLHLEWARMQANELHLPGHLRGQIPLGWPVTDLSLRPGVQDLGFKCQVSTSVPELSPGPSDVGIDVSTKAKHSLDVSDFVRSVQMIRTLASLGFKHFG